MKKVEALEVDWSRKSLLHQGGAGAGGVRELFGKTLPVQVAGLKQPESGSRASSACQSIHQNNYNYNYIHTTLPKKKQIIRPEILSHIWREELLGIVLNQLPASMCIWEQCNIFLYSLMSNSKFSLDNIFTLKSRKNLHFSKSFI